jgi:hypothetical protein
MSTQAGNVHSDDEEGAAQSRNFAHSENIIRKSCCRYGSGCTHINDPSHRDKFWHPRAPRINGEDEHKLRTCDV